MIQIPVDAWKPDPTIWVSLKPVLHVLRIPVFPSNNMIHFPAWKFRKLGSALVATPDGICNTTDALHPSPSMKRLPKFHMSSYPLSEPHCRRARTKERRRV